MLLIRNAELYAPQPRGLSDILIAGERIVAVRAAGEINPSTLSALAGLQIIDASSGIAMPGIVDRHVHFSGAGGEGGPSYRTPPLQLSSFIKGGVTSAVGLLGTDGIARSLPELLMKARGLEEEGISAYILTGSYSLPSPTLTGSVQSDLCLIDKVIGLKIAVADHRSSHPSAEELRRTLSDVRAGGILSGKAGCLCVHMGNEPEGLSLLLRAIEGTNIPITQLAPTHISRSKELLNDSIHFGRLGGRLDITAVPDDRPLRGMGSHTAVKTLIEEGISPENITLSSDANGSMPSFNEKGELTGTCISKIDSLLKAVTVMLKKKEEPAEQIIAMVTANPADHLKLPRKGRIHPGCDGDLLVMDGELHLRTVVAKGRVLMNEGEVIVKGIFE